MTLRTGSDAAPRIAMRDVRTEGGGERIRDGDRMGQRLIERKRSPPEPRLQHLAPEILTSTF
jgi:hypothetical protein